MISRSLARWARALGAAAALLSGVVSAAEVRVMISAGFYGPYAELAPAFERASGHRLVTTRGPSVGDSPEAIPTRLAGGQAADVVIMDDGAADDLARRGLVRADSKVELARSEIGMMVRAGAAKPDIGSVDAFRNALLNAKSIAYSDSTSGTYLVTTLFARLGVAEQVAAKSRKVRGPPSGEPVAAVVARGEAEIGFQQVSEILHVAGADFVGAIPAELQPRFSYSGALTTTAREPEAGRALILFLASPEAAAAISKAGLKPIAAAAGMASAAAQSSPLERGRYLVTSIMACGNCHTPKTAEGRAIPDKELAGGGTGFDIPPFAGVAANITPDVETGIGGWSDSEIKRAITHAERPDHGPLAGKPLALPMAANFFKAILPSDLDAIVAYLRSAPAVRNVLPAPIYRGPARREAFALADRGFTEIDMQDKVRRGAYLATIGHCLECHTPVANGTPMFETALGAGGRPFLPSFVKGLPERWKGAMSRNLTSHPDLGLGAWSNAEIKRAITQGVGRDGRRLQEPMAFAWYAGIRDEDLDAIVAYLRTLPPLAR